MTVDELYSNLREWGCHWIGLKAENVLELVRIFEEHGTPVDDQRLFCRHLDLVTRYEKWMAAKEFQAEYEDWLLL